MIKYVVAVSGGVDSVVLLDMLSKKSDIDIVVAHFDHGIRKDSHMDAKFVMELAEKYGFLFETERAELGEDASEEVARKKRYGFLKSVAKKHRATLVTAHHADDVVETVAINLTRGTGWRGLAVMDSDVMRPLTDMSKLDIIDYATKNNLTWREDGTNNSDKYLRNRMRKKLSSIDGDNNRQILGLWTQQKMFKNEIDRIVTQLCPISDVYTRSIFTGIDDVVAIEIIRHLTFSKLTRPQMIKSLDAIRTYLPSKQHFPGGGIVMHFSSRNFTVKLIK